MRKTTFLCMLWLIGILAAFFPLSLALADEFAGGSGGISAWFNRSTALMALLLGSLFWSAKVHDGVADKRIYAGVLGAIAVALILFPGWVFGRVVGVLLLAQIAIFLRLTHLREKRGY
ncbi:hypothetical protein [Natronocella acetinitrilica]|nr:hypothetical protein [Natronocella acetinitrilica]